MNRYYVHDLETDKLHVHTGGKSDWMTLPENDRDTVKRNCLWSKSRECWVSKAKGGRVWWIDVLTRNGFEDRGTVGARLAFAERVEARMERAEERAGRMEGRATDAAAEATARFNSTNIQTLRSMQGEPVKLGHHSAKRHLRLIEKCDNDMDKGCEAMGRKAHYERRAAASQATAEGKQYSDPGYLARRIREGEAEERQLLHKLEGKCYAYSDPKPIGDDYRGRLSAALEECRDKLGFFRHCLETCGRTVFDRASLKGKTLVLIRGTWERVVRLNPTTVSVYNVCFPTEESQRKWPLKYLYAEVRDAK
jgi:hypothetical protein